MIEAFTEWAIYPVPTPAGLLLLLLVFHAAALKRMALSTASKTGVVSPDTESETESAQKGRDR